MQFTKIFGAEIEWIKNDDKKLKNGLQKKMFGWIFDYHWEMKNHLFFFRVEFLD